VRGKRRPFNEEAIIELIQKTLYGKVLPHDDLVPFFHDGDSLALKSEMLVYSTDVPPGMSLRHVGRKAVACAVSDFAAKGVRPLVALISIAIPKSFTRKDVMLLAEGFRWAQKEFNLPILGGDTNEGQELVIDCNVLGRGRMIGRGGARDGDIVMVSGRFGYSAAGLKILLQRLNLKGKSVERAVRSVLVPKPPLQLGLSLAERRLVTASIDSSDGLALSLYQLSEASNLGIRLTSLPYDRGVVQLAKILHEKVENLVLFGGEEFHLVVGVPPELVDEARKIASQLGEELIPVGKFEKGIKGVLGVDGQQVERRGWIHLDD
jgi:thiamine-monophosphate kinase